jgi:hypothetical protein
MGDNLTRKGLGETPVCLRTRLEFAGRTVSPRITVHVVEPLEARDQAYTAPVDPVRTG